MNYLPRLASNHDPLGVCLLSSQDYRCEPPAPGLASSKMLGGLISVWEKQVCLSSGCLPEKLLSLGH
jgi:hypothetical protein